MQWQDFEQTPLLVREVLSFHKQYGKCFFALGKAKNSKLFTFRNEKPDLLGKPPELFKFGLGGDRLFCEYLPAS